MATRAACSRWSESKDNDVCDCLFSTDAGCLFVPSSVRHKQSVRFLRLQSIYDHSLFHRLLSPKWLLMFFGRSYGACLLFQWFRFECSWWRVSRLTADTHLPSKVARDYIIISDNGLSNTCIDSTINVAIMTECTRSNTIIIRIVLLVKQDPSIHSSCGPNLGISIVKLLFQ